jgi:Domain of unknown function (DUF1963)
MRMFDEPTQIVSRFRAETAARGLPSNDVEQWLGMALPAVYVAEGGEGPVVVRFGGIPMLPDGAKTGPSGQFVAAVDCERLPPRGTDLPMPSDGHLLFFADPEIGSSHAGVGNVIYVPAGTPTTERAVESAYDPYPSQQLRTLWHQPSWPHDADDDCDVEDRQWGGLPDVWSHVVGWRPDWTLQIGGHADSWNYDPVEVAAEVAAEVAGGNGGTPGTDSADDLVLLATWNCGQDVRELDLGIIHWVIRRRDLAALRFDRVSVVADMVG